MTTSVSARQDIGFQGNRDLLHSVNMQTDYPDGPFQDMQIFSSYDPQILGYSYWVCCSVCMCA